MELNLKYEDGQTPINEDEKRGLKIRSISTMSELDAFEQQNIFCPGWRPRQPAAVQYATTHQHALRRAVGGDANSGRKWRGCRYTQLRRQDCSGNCGKPTVRPDYNK